MAATDLWGDIGLQNTTAFSVPNILKDQAKLLRQKTGGDVCAEVWSSGLDQGNVIQYSFQLWSPKVPNYTYTLFRVRFDPATAAIWIETDSDRWALVPDFESWLADVLSSEDTRDKVRLLRQSASDMDATALEERTLPIQQALNALRETRLAPPSRFGRSPRYSGVRSPKPE
ncbi:MAG: hypothetical protein JST65_18095 [Acidobacteria bacterium]|nr:hypothetical protein [Acidobacteriota bacterium]